MSFAAVQKHVAVLERAGLVTKQRIGRRKVVRTKIEALQLARGLLDQYEAVWRGRIERMSDLSPPAGRPTMTVTAVQKDPENLTMVLTAEFDASPEGCGTCGPIRASSSAGGAHPRSRPP